MDSDLIDVAHRAARMIKDGTVDRPGGERHPDLTDRSWMLVLGEAADAEGFQDYPAWGMDDRLRQAVETLLALTD